MGDIFDQATTGHAAGKSGQEIGLQNELSLLSCIKREGWVREYEAALITRMSLYTVGMVSRRLAERGYIFREQSKNYSQIKPKNSNAKSKEQFVGNAGYFLRLTASGAERVNGQSGKDVDIPAAWRHHALSIQTLKFLAFYNSCEWITEAEFRHQKKLAGKIPDGQLISDTAKYYFEQEFSRKTGQYLKKQTEHIVQMAKNGTTCFIAYPYPAEISGGIDFETRLTNSLRHRWGSPEAPLVKLVRCYFDSLIAFQNVHASRFEIIDLPAMVDTANSQKDRPGVTDQVMGFRWVMNERNDMFQNRFDATLYHNDQICFEGVFIEGDMDSEVHHLKVNGEIQAKVPYDEFTFQEFIHSEQKSIERDQTAQIDINIDINSCVRNLYVQVGLHYVKVGLD